MQYLYEAKTETCIPISNEYIWRTTISHTELLEFNIERGKASQQKSLIPRKIKNYRNQMKPKLEISPV